MNNLSWGLQMAALGMGLVFGLLVVLWGLLALALRLDGPGRAAEEDDLADAPAADAGAASSAPATPPAPAGLDAAAVAAITVAVLRHRALLRSAAAPSMRSHAPGTLLHASRWVAAGRMRQNQSWQRGR